MERNIKLREVKQVAKVSQLMHCVATKIVFSPNPDPTDSMVFILFLKTQYPAVVPQESPSRANEET